MNDLCAALFVEYLLARLSVRGQVVAAKDHRQASGSVYCFSEQLGCIVSVLFDADLPCKHEPRIAVKHCERCFFLFLVLYFACYCTGYNCCRYMDFEEFL